MRMNVSLEEFRTWARNNWPLAARITEARAVAASERARVDAYAVPLCRSFGFTATHEGTPITNPGDLYLVFDAEPKVAAFYTALDAAHRAHGFTGEQGHCPALTAEYKVTVLERQLLESGSVLFGVDFTTTHGSNRNKALILLMGGCEIAQRAAEGRKE